MHYSNIIFFINPSKTEHIENKSELIERKVPVI